MSKLSWTVWIAAIATWGFYSCWHFGYQSGYADGHETALQMAGARSEGMPPIYQLAAGRDEATNLERSDAADSDQSQ